MSKINHSTFIHLEMYSRLSLFNFLVTVRQSRCCDKKAPFGVGQSDALNVFFTSSPSTSINFQLSTEIAL